MADLEALVSGWGIGPAMALAGLLAGLLFGFMAQRSQFCLRAAVVEFVSRSYGRKLAIWLLAFGSAILSLQMLVAAGLVDLSGIRALDSRGSLSGAVLGGLMFGIGMVLARGCASRLLVLSATGNMRALVTGLVFVVTAQAAWQGALEPLRLALSELWTIEGGPSRDWMARLGGGTVARLAFAGLWVSAALVFAWRGKISAWGWIGGVGAGLAVALAYLLSSRIGAAGMETGMARGITFSGPSAELLMRILAPNGRAPGFDTLLVPGVFLGSALGALMAGEWRLTVFDTRSGMMRYMAGAVLMGFGSIMAGGCAVGAGISGGAIFSVTAWLALLGMWLGAGITHLVLDAPKPTGHDLPADLEPARIG
ncbi:MAG: YeeE/YedE family protein [Beijerinckiaceae bacterium]|nr:YeeE/YedE family protein [Beijerinckiaceae bacterium]